MMPSWPQLLILILVIVLLFGTKKLRSLGSDLGASIKGFKKAISDQDSAQAQKDNHHLDDQESSNKTSDNKAE